MQQSSNLKTLQNYVVNLMSVWIVMFNEMLIFNQICKGSAEKISLTVWGGMCGCPWNH